MPAPTTIQDQSKEYIAADFRLFSGCADHQTSADVSNVSNFRLPDPAGNAGGACTSAMLQILYADHHDTGKDLSWLEVLLQMRKKLAGSFSQIPQLSSSRPLNIHHHFEIIPQKNFSGTRRAVMIGINYTGTNGELSGCQNDVHNMKSFIKDVHGFKESNIKVLMDDGKHAAPTKGNILHTFQQLVASCKSGDAVFIHYAGHGGMIVDDDGDEEDGFDETLVPIDYRSAGHIRDDDLFDNLVKPMAAGVTVTCVIDCCHSGTILDLPFVLKGDGYHSKMDLVAKGFHTKSRFDAMKPGTPVSLNFLVNRPERNGDQGQVIDYDSKAERYIVSIDNTNETMSVAPSNLLQHVQVEIFALDKYPELNGQFGTIVDWDHYKDRYRVHVPARQQVVTLKPANIVMKFGTVVEVMGLERNQKINGKWGTIKGFDHVENRYEVQLETDLVIKPKLENIVVNPPFPLQYVVRLYGLVHRPELNGNFGTILNWNPRKERYKVDVMNPPSVMYLKPGNVILKTGVVGVISGLYSKPDLNGSWGVIKLWNKKIGRYDVEMTPDWILRIKPDNIVVLH